MATHASEDKLSYLYDTLAPVMAQASIGEFGAQLEPRPGDDPRISELIMGYQVLLDVIHQQAAELAAMRMTLPAATPALGLLDDLLAPHDD